MWTYNKVLEYPVNIKCPNPRLAKFIISQIIVKLFFIKTIK